MFSFYQMPLLNKLFDSSFSADASVSMVQEHYKNISKEMNYKVLPPEDVINSLGYNFLQNSMMDKSYAFFKMNIDDYPGSFNVYDSMGDFYAAKKDKQKAMEFYSKALSITPSPDTKKKLDDLKNGK